MKIKELLEVIQNGLTILIFDWDTNKTLYEGQNLEANLKLKEHEEKTVLFLTATSDFGFKYLEIGVK